MPRRRTTPNRRAPTPAPRKRLTRQSDTLSATVTTIKNDFGSPTVLLTLGICALLAFTHATDPSRGLIGKIADWMIQQNATKPIGQFVKAHLTQTIGAVVYTITTYTLAPNNQKGTWILAGLAAAFLLPDRSLYQYVGHAMILSLYLRAKRNDVRIALIGLAVALWAFGYIQ